MYIFPSPAHKTTHFYVILMLLFFPLFFGPNGYVNITEFKYFFFVGLSCLWLVSLAVCGIIALKTGTRPIPPASPVFYALSAFALVACVSALVSPFGVSTIIGLGRFDGLITLLLYYAIFLGISTFAQPREIYFAVFAVSVSVCCVVAIFQLFGFNPFRLFPGEHTHYDAHTLYTSEFLGTIGNTNLLSGLISLALPLFAALFITGTQKHRSLYLIPLVLCTYTLIASRVAGGTLAVIVCAVISAPILLTDTQRIEKALLVCSAASLSAAFALSWKIDYTARMLTAHLNPGAYSYVFLPAAFVALLIFALLRIKKPVFHPQHLKKSLWITIAVAALIFLLFLFFFPFREESGTLFEFSRVLHGDIRDGFGSSRIQIWRKALELFKERPILGGGPGTFASRADIEFSRYIPETGDTLRTFVNNAHNDFLGYLTDFGAFGFITYTLALILTLYLWFRRNANPSASAIGSALLGYWIQSFFGLNLFIVAPFMWIFWGLFESKHHYISEKEDS